MPQQTHYIPDEEMLGWAQDAIRRRNPLVQSNPQIVTEVSDVPIGALKPPAVFRDEIRGVGTQECICPEGLAETYCTDDPFGTYLTLIQTGDCTWCGYSAGAEDERQKYEIAITDDYFGDGVCGWILSIAEGSLILFKPWDDGNPVGVYENPSEMVLQEVYATCVDPVSIPCTEPCENAPARIDIDVDFAGTAVSSEICGEVDVPITFIGSVGCDLEWDAECREMCGSDGELSFTCTSPCTEVAYPVEFGVELYLIDQWYISPYLNGIGGNVVCNRTKEVGLTNEFALGADPVGTHNLNVTDGDDSVDFTIVIS